MCDNKCWYVHRNFALKATQKYVLEIELFVFNYFLIWSDLM